MRSRYQNDEVEMIESFNANTKANYEVPYAYRKHFSPEECTELVNSFKNYDQDNSGVIEVDEFRSVLKDIGHGD